LILRADSDRAEQLHDIVKAPETRIDKMQAFYSNRKKQLPQSWELAIIPSGLPLTLTVSGYFGNCFLQML
jgi:hypothetical protein